MASTFPKIKIVWKLYWFHRAILGENFLNVIRFLKRLQKVSSIFISGINFSNHMYLSVILIWKKPFSITPHTLKQTCRLWGWCWLPSILWSWLLTETSGQDLLSFLQLSVLCSYTVSSTVELLVGRNFYDTSNYFHHLHSDLVKLK